MKRLLKKADTVDTIELHSYIFISPIKITITESNDYNNSMDLSDFDSSRLNEHVYDSLNETLSSEIKDLGESGLAEYINDKELKDVIKSIFVNTNLAGENFYAHTYVMAKKELSNEEIEKLQDYLIGQFADGFGEGFEQRAIYEWDDTDEIESIDDETGESYIEEEPVTFSAYAHLYNSNNFYIKLSEGI